MANTKRVLDDFNFDPANEPQWYRFASACVRDCGETELGYCMNMTTGDAADMAEWGVSPKQWRRAIAVAYNTVRAERLEDEVEG